MTRYSFLLPALAIALMAGCDTPLPTPAFGAMRETGIIRATTTSGPPGARPGSCWARHVSPAIVEIVTEQIMLQPAEVLDDGTVINPAVYKTETHQAIVRERRENWFATPCEDLLTYEFIASVQRALKARRYYGARVSGEMDGRTLAAIRRYQKDQGLDSSILSLKAAQKLGLVAVPRETN